MLNKKAQITLFIIITIIIVAVAILTLFLYPTLLKPEEKIAAPITSYLESCVKQHAVEGIFLLGKQGGYYNVSSPFGHYYEVTMPFFFKSGESLFPPIGEFQEEFSYYMEDRVDECLDGLDNFKQQGYEFEIDRNKTNIAVFFSTSTIIEINYSIKVSKDKMVVLLNPIKTKIDFNFVEKYSIVEQIIEEQKKTSNSIPLLFLIALSEREGFEYEIIDLTDFNYALVLFFENRLRDEPYIFSFLLGYNWTEFEPKTEIKIEPIPEFNITNIKIFEYKINATGEDLDYYAFTDLFNVSEDGMIRFNTSVLDSGRSEILIRITDVKNTKAYTFIIFNVNIQK